MEQGKAFVTLASDQHADNGCHPVADAVNTRCVRVGMLAVGYTVWPINYTRVVPAIVKLHRFH